MGVPEIKYGDSICFVQHVATSLWLTYKAQDAKSARLGPLKRKVMFWVFELLVKSICRFNYLCCYFENVSISHINITT